MQHLIRIDDFSNEELFDLLEQADDIIANLGYYSSRLQGKIMASLFFEPSTRTKLSFDAAMMRLGGQVIGHSDMKNSSTTKGETLEDTIRTVSHYSDVIVMRHPVEGTPKQASLVSEVPIINAGDGKGEHPTQTLTDMMTIKSKLGRLTNLNLVLCGDLKYGRTVHSLTLAMKRFEGNTFHFVSPESLEMPSHITDQLETGSFHVYRSIEEALDQADVLYMTRVQRERFEFIEDYYVVKDSVLLTQDKLEGARDNMIIMHPLPRVNEVELSIDDDPRAVYFDQVEYGMYIRMALILKLVKQASAIKVKKSNWI